MGVFQRAADAVKGWFGRGARDMTSASLLPEDSPSVRYEKLLSLYKNDRPFERIRLLPSNVNERLPDDPEARRNPANRTVEFYAAKLWGGKLEEAFELEGDVEDPIKEAVESIFKWSNWSHEKQPASRKYSIGGNMWLRSAQTEIEEVSIEDLDPRDVTDFDEDLTGEITYIRLDIPKKRRDREKDELKHFIRTEIWDKEEGDVRIWESDKPKGSKVQDLGEPQEIWYLSEEDVISSKKDENGNPINLSLGITYIPIRHAKFKDIGEDLGQGCFEHAVPAIKKVSEMASGLHEILFPDELLAFIPQGVTADNRPLPAIKLDASSVVGAKDADDDASKIKVGKRKIFLGPGNTRVESLIPNINFDAHLNAIDKELLEIGDLLPETRVHKIAELVGSQSSGVAIKYMLTEVIDRITEARGNGIAAIIEALKDAMHIAAIRQLTGFEGFDDREAIEMEFVEREVFPLTELEKAQTDKAEMDALEAKGRVLSLPVSELRKEAGVEDVQPLGPNDTVAGDGVGNQDAVTRIVQQLGTTNGR